MTAVLDAKPTIIGRPGAYASKLMFKRGGRAAALVVVAIPVFWLLWKMHSPILYVLAPAVTFGSRQMWGKARAAGVGARSERLVLNALRHSPYIKTIWCGLRPGEVGGDIDMCIETRSGHFYVVEIKTGSGQLRMQDGRLVAGRRVIPGDPVAQVEAAARRASRHFNRNVWRVVCVPEGTGDPFVVKGTYICNRVQLHQMITTR